MQVAQTCSFVIYACLKFCWKENKNDIAVTMVCAFAHFDQLIGNKTFPCHTICKPDTQCHFKSTPVHTESNGS